MNCLKIVWSPARRLVPLSGVETTAPTLSVFSSQVGVSQASWAVQPLGVQDRREKPEVNSGPNLHGTQLLGSKAAEYFRCATGRLERLLSAELLPLGDQDARSARCKYSAAEPDFVRRGETAEPRSPA